MNAMEGFLAPNSERKTIPRNAQINGFRTLLCCLIIAYHYGGIFFVHFGSLSKMPSLYANLVIVVVGIFYVLSGFFLSFRNPWDFLKSKFFRIYLPFAITTALVFFICYYSGYPKYIGYPAFGLNLLIYPLAMSQAGYAAGNLWFVVYLWVFYTIYFLLNLLAYPFRKKINLVPILMAICGVFSFAYGYISWNEKTASFGHLLCNMLFSGHYRSFVFLYLGYFLSLAYHSLINKAKWGYTLSAFLLSLLFLSFLMVQLFGIDHYHYASALLFFGLFALFILCLWNKLPFFKWGAFQVIGSSSMWIYLIHENIGYLIINAFYALDSSLYPVGLYLALVYAFLGGMTLNFLYEKALSSFRKRPSL
jgi:peptidoglycan/LPS O-acetylase OafA/YrhL